jgi:AAA family ATP:ADP antiporter
LFDVRPGEGRAVLWSAAYFFFLLSSYYVIRPLRDEMGLRGTDQTLTWLFMGTLAGTIVANPVFGALVARFPRRVFIPAVYHVLALNLLVFYGLLQVLPPDGRVAVARVFFVWASVFNLFAVSVFWGFMADLWRSADGKRLFGLIGVGGTAGAIAGSTIVAGLASAVGPVHMLVAAALLLEAAVLCVRRLVTLFGATGPETPTETAGQGAMAGLRLLLTRPYLLGIAGFLFLYAQSSTFLYFEQARIVRAAFSDSGARAAFFARIDLAVNGLALVTQLFFTGRIVRGAGVGASLAVLPLLTEGGFAALAALPATSVLMVVQVLRRAAEFALVRPTRELLYTVVGRDEKYTAKSLVDTFVYRGADAVGAWTDRLLGVLAAGAWTLALAFLPLAAGWFAIAAWLGRKQRAMAETAADAAAAARGAA